MLVQSVEIRYPNSSKKIRPAPIRHDLFKVDQSTVTSTPAKTLAERAYYTSQKLPLCLNESTKIEEVVEGEEWTYRKLARLLHDDHLRPTTMDYSTSRIRMSHALGVEIRYKKIGSQGEQRVQLLQSLQVASCCTSRDSLQLPSYSKDPQPNVESIPGKYYCICDLSFEELYQEEDTTIFEIPKTSQITFVTDLQSKSQAVGSELGVYRSQTWGGRSGV